MKNQTNNFNKTKTYAAIKKALVTPKNDALLLCCVGWNESKVSEQKTKE
jgi:hypothetical protein